MTTGPSCRTCRHFVPVLGAGGDGACHLHATIFSPRLGAWTPDRSIFSQAAARVGLWNYKWAGLAVKPDHSCPDHETTTQALEDGVPEAEIKPRRPAPRRQRKAPWANAERSAA